jgi:two-component system chemotaxis sensor kinase CheA
MDDPELRALFAAEVAERASRLVDAAQLARSGTATDGDLEMLRREAHTIKGTARMMGFTALGDAGFAAEQAMPEVDSPVVAAALERLGGTFVEAVGADPEVGTPAMAEAVAALSVTLGGELPPDDTPDPGGDDVGGVFPEAAPAIPDGPAPVSDSSDLGGLLAALDSWALGETVRVNAASLFKLINEICSLRVDTEVLETLVLAATPDGGGNPDPDLLSRLRAEVMRTGRDAGDLQRRAIELASAPVSEITNTFPQLLRYLSRKIGKEVRFELVGDDLMADRQVLERIADPLRQLLVNAVHHGLEPAVERLAAGKPRTGRVSLQLSIKENKLEVVVEDDGRGVDWPAVHRKAVEQGLVPQGAPADPDRLRSLLFSDGFGTAEASDLVTGDGSGLSAVTEAVEALHGTVMFETTPGEGTRVVIVVPVSRALQDVILIKVAGEQWGIPEIAVLDRFEVADISFDGAAPHLGTPEPAGRVHPLGSGGVPGRSADRGQADGGQGTGPAAGWSAPPDRRRAAGWWGRGGTGRPRPTRRTGLGIGGWR